MTAHTDKDRFTNTTTVQKSIKNDVATSFVKLWTSDVGTLVSNE